MSSSAGRFDADLQAWADRNRAEGDQPEAGLFPEPERAGAAADADDRTPGERRRDRLAAAVARGEHPLSVPLRSPIRLHPDAVAELTPGRGLRCGSCMYRRMVHGGNRAYPKCQAAYGARVTHGEATDVRAGWPACTEHEASADA